MADDSPDAGPPDARTEGYRAFVRERLVANTGASIAANVWAMAVSVVALPIMLSGLGIEAFGVWALLQTFSALTGWFSLLDLGVGVSSVRAIATHESLGETSPRDVVVSTTIAYYALVGASAGVLFAGGGLSVIHGFELGTDRPYGSLDLVVILVGCQIGVDLASRSLVVVLEGLHRVDVARGLDVIRRTLVAASWAVAAKGSGSLAAVGMAGLGASVVSTVTSYSIYHRVADVRRVSPSRRVLVQLLRAGASVAVLRPLGVIHRTMDRIIVGIIVGPTAVAAVELATSLQNGADAVLSASSYSVTPSASFLDAQRDTAGLRALFLNATRLTLLITVPVAISIVILSSPIVDVWIGDEAPPDSAFLAAIAALYVIEVAAGAVGSNLLLGVGSGNTVLRAALISITINLTLSVWLGLELGARGVFYATCISAVALVPELVRPALRRTATTLRGFMARSVAPGLAPGAAYAVALLAVRLTIDSSVLALLISGLAAALVVVPLTYAVGLSGRERIALRRRVGLQSSA